MKKLSLVFSLIFIIAISFGIVACDEEGKTDCEKLCQMLGDCDGLFEGKSAPYVGGDVRGCITKCEEGDFGYVDEEMFTLVAAELEETSCSEETILCTILDLCK